MNRLERRLIMKTLTPIKRQELGPWSGFQALEERLNRIFGGFPMEFESVQGAWMPSVDLHEGKDAYTLKADLPGVSKDNLELNVVDDVVTLKGHRSQEQERDEEGYHRVERSYGSFQRAFRIPGGIDATRVEAKFDNGVLSVTLPKREENRPKQIKVDVK
jgi:HSP20 family protein